MENSLNDHFRRRHTVQYFNNVIAPLLTVCFHRTGSHYTHDQNDHRHRYHASSLEMTNRSDPNIAEERHVRGKFWYKRNAKKSRIFEQLLELVRKLML